MWNGGLCCRQGTSAGLGVQLRRLRDEPSICARHRLAAQEVCEAALQSFPKQADRMGCGISCVHSARGAHKSTNDSHARGGKACRTPVWCSLCLGTERWERTGPWQSHLGSKKILHRLVVCLCCAARTHRESLHFLLAARSFQHLLSVTLPKQQACM